MGPQDVLEVYPFADESLTGIAPPRDAATDAAEARMRRRVLMTVDADGLAVRQDADNRLWLMLEDRYGAVTLGWLVLGLAVIHEPTERFDGPFSHWCGLPRGRALLEVVSGWRELWRF